MSVFKAIARSTKTKKDCNISLRISRISGKVTEDIRLQIVWKRGVAMDNTTGNIELNEFEEDAEVNHTFNKVSGFYTRDEVKYDKKECEILIKKLVGPSNEAITIA